jgi:hypothetical protein
LDRHRTVVCVAFLTCAASCTPSHFEPSGADTLEARVDAILLRRGLGRDALGVIDNTIRHEAPPPPAAPPLVRELLAQPLRATHAAALFDGAVPEAVRQLVAGARTEPNRSRARARPIELRELLDPYVEQLARAQRLLRAASAAPIDPEPAIAELRDDLPSAGTLQTLAARIDRDVLAQATQIFVDATVRFVADLRAAGTQLVFPAKPLRYDSPIGVVSVGTLGDEVHGPDAALIVDPGGNDIYERRPATQGAISVIVDLGGDDLYRGSDVAVQGLSAIIDLAGNDRYTTSGPGLAAALVGASLLIDWAGDDVYEAGLFGEGAAAFGLGALIDLHGDDRYRLRAGGQGFAVAGGIGLLWDGAGNDRYEASSGIEDAFGRGGAVSFAQGAAYGVRNRLGGGIGILRDDAGDDRYQAQLFAQGVGYYYGAGLLWDRAGDDRYLALRYAQGAGVHEAVGVLRDEAGDDRYELGFGVGQGMGLDLALGILLDGAGDDRYRASSLAQGSASANGFGLLVDGGGSNAWQMGADRHAWGAAEWQRGLPSVGILAYQAEHAVFERDGTTLAGRAEDAQWGGPLGDTPASREPEGALRCPPLVETVDRSGLPLADALRRIAPGFAGASVDTAAYAEVRRRLGGGLAASLAQLPRDDFEVSYSLRAALRCALVAAPLEAAAALRNEIENVVRSDAATPFAAALLGALRERPAPPPQMVRILDGFDRHPSCAVRSEALALRHALAVDAASRTAAKVAAQAALRSSCWRLQAEALAVLEGLGVAPQAGISLPSFLGVRRE